jgi:hypothetical protein
MFLFVNRFISDKRRVFNLSNVYAPGGHSGRCGGHMDIHGGVHVDGPLFGAHVDDVHYPCFEF